MNRSTPEILDDVMVVIFLYLIKSDEVLNRFKKKQSESVSSLLNIQTQ